MTEKREIACGIDVHKNILVVTILNINGDSSTQDFPNTLEGILSLRSLVEKERCDVVAFESTGNYWLKLHDALSPIVPVEVANAYFIKHVPGKKTDTLDSQWIAQLALNNLITPSRIFEGDDRDLRSLTRFRSKLVDDRSFYKNRIHMVLDSAHIRLSSVLTDIFGKTGLLILHALAQGDDIESIFKKLPPRMYAKKEDLKKAVAHTLSQCELLELRSSLNMLDLLNQQIETIEEQIAYLVQKLHMNEYSILCSIPGIGNKSASIIISEIGDISDFESAGKLCSWAGIVPQIYQSAGKLRTGHITKMGNKHLRWILVECAHSCAKNKKTKLYSFFKKLEKRIGYKKAIVALARKLLSIIWHLLTNNEMFENEGYQKNGEVSISGFLKLVNKIGEEEALELIHSAQVQRVNGGLKIDRGRI